MRERPIPFSAPMVRAVLAGTKTQTRRVVKPQFVADALPVEMPATDPAGGWVVPGHSGAWWCEAAANPDDVRRCPYGVPGDHLWVKETWRTAKSLDAKSPAAIGAMCVDAGYRKPWAPLAYEADGHRNSEWRGFELGGDAEPGKTRVSIHMPRWASRILLEVTGVRVERLQDISEADAKAEGVERLYDDEPGYVYRDEPDFKLCPCCGGTRLYTAFSSSGGALPDTDCAKCDTYVKRYRWLWEAINGPASWDANPWVWVVEFRRLA